MTNEFERIKGKRPTPDHVWCDECLRWECDDESKLHKRRARLRPRGIAKVLYRLSSFISNKIVAPINNRADLAFLRDNARHEGCRT